MLQILACSNGNLGLASTRNVLFCWALWSMIKWSWHMAKQTICIKHRKKGELDLDPADEFMVLQWAEWYFRQQWYRISSIITTIDSYKNNNSYMEPIAFVVLYKSHGSTPRVGFVPSHDLKCSRMLTLCPSIRSHQFSFTHKSHKLRTKWGKHSLSGHIVFIQR